MLNWQEYIESNSDKLYGKPVIKNTRVPVDLILEKMAKGESIEQLLKAYPHISDTAIYACLLFASDVI